MNFFFFNFRFFFFSFCLFFPLSFQVTELKEELRRLKEKIDSEDYRVMKERKSGRALCSQENQVIKTITCPTNTYLTGSK